MSTRDPFLITIGVIVDRVLVWLTLTVIVAGITWSAVLERGLGMPWSAAALRLQALWLGTADRTIVVLAVLTLTVAVLASTLMSTWLFALWRKQGQFGATHLRGPHIKESDV